MLSTKHPHEMLWEMNRDVHREYRWVLIAAQYFSQTLRYANMKKTGMKRSDPLDLDAQRLDQCLRRGVTVREVLDLLVRVDDGGVVAVEETADGRP